MRNIVLSLIAVVILTACSKENIKPELPTYEVKIEADGYYYALKVETSYGKGTVYFNDADLQGAKTYILRPVNSEPVALYYVSVSGLKVKIWIDGKLVINQTQPQGSGVFYLHKNM